MSLLEVQLLGQQPSLVMLQVVIAVLTHWAVQVPAY